MKGDFSKIFSPKSLYLCPQIVFKNLKRISKNLSYHFNIHYKYQNFFQTNKFVTRRFFQSKLMSILFKRLKKKLRFFSKKYSTLYNLFINFFSKLRVGKFRQINPLKFFLYKKISKLEPRTSNFTLRRKIFLSTPNLTKIAADFIYMVAKDRASTKQLFTKHYQPKRVSNKQLFKTKKNSKVIFYNAHKSLICKMRNGRFSHWWTQTQGTLNERRYDKLLARELHTYLNYFQKQLLNVVITSVYCCFLSWKQPKWFFDLKLCLVNGKPLHFAHLLQKGDIVELPLGPGLVDYNFFNKKYYLSKLMLAKRFLYKTRFQKKPKGKLAHRCPRVIQRLPTGLQTLGKLIAVDAGLKTVGVLYTLPYLTHSVTGNILVSAVLTLQNWRFRFD